mgnify:CR=1 FL=1
MKLENCFGQHGWKEFHRNRKDILAELDRILELIENRPIQVAHGQAVEAFLRKWLTEFLPKKYGVTSGYIIPDLYGDNQKLYHYDIIIYNRLDAPVLWTEGNEDNSEQGKFRAIPAKHVIAVYEVKSRLTKKNVADALNKLDETKDFHDQLNECYSCGAIFIDLKECDNNKESIIKELIKGKDIFGFSGGVVLRYENDDTCTGIIKILDFEPENKEEYKRYMPLAKPIDDLDICLNEEGGLEISEKGGGARLVATSDKSWSVSKQYGVMFNEGTKTVDLSWSRSNFSEFCVNLLSELEGLPYNDENRPSFGRVFDNIERKITPLQSEESEDGKPFLKVSIYEGDKEHQKLNIDNSVDDPIIYFSIKVENVSDVGVVVSDDFFKNQCELGEGKTGIKPVILRASLKKKDKDLKSVIEREGLEILYRLVYYAEGSEKEYYAIERKVKITTNDIQFV